MQNICGGGLSDSISYHYYNIFIMKEDLALFYSFYCKFTKLTFSVIICHILSIADKTCF